MFFNITTKAIHENFSYILVKNPASVYGKESKQGQKCIGKYTQNGDPSFQTFNCFVINDSKHFTKNMKAKNLSSYVNSIQNCVCPFNLLPVAKCFDSVIKGKNKDLTQQEYNEPMWLSARIGPFAYYSDKFAETITNVFNDCDIDVNFDRKEKDVFILNCFGAMSLTQFVQKLYVLSYWITSRISVDKTSQEQIDKFVELSKSWLDKIESKHLIIRGLSKNHKGFEKEFIEKAEIENSDEIKQKLYIGHESLHEKRHNKIVEILNIITEEEKLNVWEFGCGNGKLLKKVSKLDNVKKVYGCDSKPVDKVFCPRSAKVFQMNMMYSNFAYINEMKDVVILSEVLEHLEVNDRKQFLNSLINQIVPKKIILSVPNKDYNKYYGIEDGKYRHRDHKTEYTKQTLDEEIINVLRTKYAVGFQNILEDTQFDKKGNEITEDIQPSFLIVAELIDEENKSIAKTIQKNSMNYSSYFLPISDYEVRTKELSIGYSSLAFMKNHKNIFYLGATVPPCDYNSNYPDYLEHPSSVFNYYAKRGITKLVAEKKYMGSRAYVLVFKDKTSAQLAGFEKTIIINSRKGYVFFDDEKLYNGVLGKDILENIEKDVLANFSFGENDFVAFDCEITPWSLKAGGLITKQFEIPGICSLVDREEIDAKQILDDKESFVKLLNTEHYMDRLKFYTGDEALKINVFGIVAMGSINSDRRKFEKVVLGNYINNVSKHKIIKSIIKNSVYFNSCEYWEVDTEDFCNRDFITKEWEDSCRLGSEGFVFKPYNPVNYLSNGYWVQQMIKCRGVDYLRLIYGIDYLSESCFEIIKNRSIKRKRLQAIQETEMGMQIVRAFTSNKKNVKDRLIAGFFGTDSVNYSNVDKTL